MDRTCRGEPTHLFPHLVFLWKWGSRERKTNVLKRCSVLSNETFVRSIICIAHTFASTANVSLFPVFTLENGHEYYLNSQFWILYTKFITGVWHVYHLSDDTIEFFSNTLKWIVIRLMLLSCWKFRKCSISGPIKDCGFL